MDGEVVNKYILSGDVKKIKNICKSHQLSVTPEVFHQVVSKKDKKMALFILKNTAMDGVLLETVMLSLSYKWRSISYTLLKINGSNITSITNPDYMIIVVEFGDESLSKRMLCNKALDYHGEHEKVMIYLCRRAKLSLFKSVIGVCYVDPDHKDQLFLKEALENHRFDIVEVFLKRGTVNLTPQLETLMTMRRAGGI
jgi:hypothetical protein